MGKKKQGSPFTGLWHIIAMSEWDEDYFNEEVQAFTRSTCRWTMAPCRAEA